MDWFQKPFKEAAGLTEAQVLTYLLWQVLQFPGNKMFPRLDGCWQPLPPTGRIWANGLAATTGTASSVCCEGPKICEKESKGLSFLFTTTVKSPGFMPHPSGFLSHLFWCSQPSHLLNAYLMAHDRLTAHLFVVAHTGEKSLHLLKDALIECCESNLLNNCAGKMGLAFVAEDRKADE